MTLVFEPRWTRVVAACTIVALTTLPAAAKQAPHEFTTSRKGAQTETVQAPDARSARETFSLNRVISLNLKQVTLGAALIEVSRQSGVRIGGDASIVPREKRVSLVASKITVRGALGKLLRGTGIIPVVQHNGHIILQRDSIHTDTTKSQGHISGSVIDTTTGQPVAGATIIVQGTSLSTVTNPDGSYSILHVPAGPQVITVRGIGYSTSTRHVIVSPDTRTDASFFLRSTATQLMQVVTTATGQQRRVEVGHDIATINADSLLNVAPIRTVSDLLSVARVPGVTVEPTSGLPGAPSRIRIRGIGSIMGDNDPAVFVDGVRISASTSGKRMVSDVDPNSMVSSRLDDIDPQTIETIEVLRGPSAGALYGSDAANGVIVITTKKGKVGPTRWSVYGSRDWNDLPRARPPLYTGWGTGQTSEAPVKCAISDVVAGSCVQDSVRLLRADSDPLFTAEAPGATTMYSATMDGGASLFRYRVTGTFKETLGPTKMRLIDQIRYRKAGFGVPSWLARPNELTNTNLSTNVTIDMAKEFDLGFNLQLIQQDRSNNKGTVVATPPENADTTRSFDPLTVRANEVISRVVLSAQSNWRQLSWLTGTVTGGIDRSMAVESRIREQYLCRPECTFPTRGRDEARRGETVLSFTAQGILSQWGNQALRRWVSILPTFGINVTQSYQDRVLVTVDSLRGDGSWQGALWNGSANATGDSLRTASAGVYVDFRVGLIERLYTSIGLRRDIGSAFGNRSGLQNYPKFNTSWLISDEPFFPKGWNIDALRLRFAAGIAGVQPVQGSVEGGYIYSQAVMNGELVPGIEPTIAANPRLKPERGIETEYGFDLEMFGQRLALGVTAAEKNSRNVIISQMLPPSVLGNFFIRRYDNIGHVRNRTIEMSLESRMIERPSILWTMQTRASTQTNRVLEIGAMLDPNYTGNNGQVRVGYPIGGRWERPVLRYADRDADGLLTESEIVRGDSVTYMGWGQPKYSVSYGTSLSLFGRRVTVTADLAHDVGLTQAIGNALYGGSNNASQTRGKQDITASLAEQALSFGCTGVSGCGAVTSQTFSTLRWNAASLSINMPQHLVRPLRAKTLMIEFSGRNLALWTRYRGRDPSVNSIAAGEARLDPGDLIPPPRTFAITTRVGF